MSELDPNAVFANFVVDNPGGIAPLKVTFTNTSKNASGLTPQWEFGDGAPWAYGDRVVHTYNAVNASGFPATLRLLGENTATIASATVTIKVSYANTGDPATLKKTKLEAMGKTFRLGIIDTVLIDAGTSVQLNVTVEAFGSNVIPNLKKDFTIRINRITSVA